MKRIGVGGGWSLPAYLVGEPIGGVSLPAAPSALTCGDARHTCCYVSVHLCPSVRLLREPRGNFSCLVQRSQGVEFVGCATTRGWW